MPGPFSSFCFFFLTLFDSKKVIKTLGSRAMDTNDQVQSPKAKTLGHSNRIKGPLTITSAMLAMDSNNTNRMSTTRGNRSHAKMDFIWRKDSKPNRKLSHPLTIQTMNH